MQIKHLLTAVAMVLGTALTGQAAYAGAAPAAMAGVEKQTAVRENSALIQVWHGGGWHGGGGHGGGWHH